AERDRSPKPLPIELPLAVIGVEAKEAQDAQVVLFDTRRRIADETHPAGKHIVIAAERIEQGPVARRIERIEGKVAPTRVLGPILGERNCRMAPEGLDVEI